VSNLDLGADGSGTITLSQHVHTRKVVLDGYSLSTANVNNTVAEGMMFLELDWLSSPVYNIDILTTNVDHAIKLPVEMDANVKGTFHTGLNWDFPVVSSYIPRTFRVRLTNSSGTKFLAGQTYYLVLYFEFQDRVEGV
jgi:hypothetical protein